MVEERKGFDVIMPRCYVIRGNNLEIEVVNYGRVSEKWFHVTEDKGVIYKKKVKYRVLNNGGRLREMINKKYYIFNRAEQIEVFKAFSEAVGKKMEKRKIEQGWKV